MGHSGHKTGNDRKSEQLDEPSSIASAHKGVEGGGWRGGQGLDLKMEADHDWSPDTRLQGCAGSLVVDIVAKSTQQMSGQHYEAAYQ